MSNERAATGPVIGRTIADSVPWFPDRPHPAGRPNVVVVVLDDVGFAQLGPFGSDIETPTLDRLADEGLRFNRFHVTALCSPTRAALLTGRNHHAVGTRGSRDPQPQRRDLPPAVQEGAAPG